MRPCERLSSATTYAAWRTTPPELLDSDIARFLGFPTPFSSRALKSSAVGDAVSAACRGPPSGSSFGRVSVFAFASLKESARLLGLAANTSVSFSFSLLVLKDVLGDGPLLTSLPEPLFLSAGLGLAAWASGATDAD
eukprot:3448028-Prymnesium_polylepis.1